MSEAEQTKPIKKRKSKWRWLLLAFGTLFVLLLLAAIGVVIAFKTGYIDKQIRNALVERFTEFGIKAEIESVKTTISPTTAELTNLQFSDEITGEKLAKIDKLKIDLTILNILGLNSKREVNVDSTDVEGLEVWVKFDKDGKSNFSNLKFKADEDPNLKISIASVNFSLKNALIHYGDDLRKISGDAKNLTIAVEPENLQVAENERRYKFDFRSEKSVFNYNNKPIEPIDVYAKGIADKNGAEIGNLTIKTPLGESVLSGNVKDWQSPKYDFKIASTVDLQQTANVLPTGATLRGFGNVEGTVKGEGEKYQIEGEIQSDALSAENVYLKALQITGKIDGENQVYNANGKAIAEMLTAGDFVINFPQLLGNVRGNGADFKWFGELRAAALKNKETSIVGLMLSDAVAEYQDKKFSANGDFSAKTFNNADVNGENITAQNVQLTSENGKNDINVPNLSAGKLTTKDATLAGVNADEVKVQNSGDKTNVSIAKIRTKNLDAKDAKLKNVNANDVKLSTGNGKTDVAIKNVQAENLDTKDAKIRNLNAGDVTISNRGNSTNITSKEVTADNLDANGAKIEGVSSTDLNAQITGNETKLTSNGVRAGKITADGAVLGSINVAGVRLTIREGRIEGESTEILADEVNLTKTKQNPDGGNLANVRLTQNVFVLEPSGKYRASMDMSLGSGVLGKLKIGQANAKVVATNEQVELSELNANVIDGKINGNVLIALNTRNTSKVNLDFNGLELSKLMAMQGGKVLPIAGKTSGKVDLSFSGTDFKNASGTVIADFKANAGSEAKGLIPLDGKLGVKATNGLFNVDYANFNTEKSAFTASGRFDLDGNNSNLQIALNSTDAREVRRLINVLGVAPELEENLTAGNVDLAGNLTFNGTLTGNIEEPNIEGKTTLDSVLINGGNVGSLASNVFVTSKGVEIRDGILRQAGGGNAFFNVQVPKIQNNNIALQATLNNFNPGELVKLFKDYIPETLQDFSAQTTGKIDMTGLPNEMHGYAELSSKDGVIAKQPFDTFESRFTFDKTIVTIEKMETKYADSSLRLFGTYDGDSTVFDLNFTGSNLEAERLAAFFPQNKSFPKITGLIQMGGKATGEVLDFSTYVISLSGAGSKLKVNDTEAGGIAFNVSTENKVISAVMIASFETQQQKVFATLDLGKEGVPLTAWTEFNNTELAPYIALFQTSDSVTINGRATGKVEFGGNLNRKNANGDAEFITDELKGTAQFSQLSFQFDETPIVATEPLLIRFDLAQAVVENAKFGGAGSNIIVSGTKALNDKGINNLAVNGKLNLRFIDKFTRNTFFGGLADVGINLNGSNADSRLSGTATTENATIATFVNSERLTFERIKAKVLFTSNQMQIESAIGYVGGGKVVGTGGAVIEGLQLQKFRLQIDGTNVTTPLPRNYLTTGDASIEITGEKLGKDYNTLISGKIFGKRSTYTKDIDLADVIGTRRQGTINAGTTPSPFGVPKLDLQIEGREVLNVKNNIADLVASVSLRVTGDIDFPQVTGRLTSTTGTLFFRNDRYEIRRGVLELPPNSDEDTILNLQAEAEIKGYQLFVDVSGSLSDLENLSINARSNPNLPQADVVSLITTGSLSNTDTGIPTLAQSGLNTAANILTDSLINNPVRRATDKLFGLNKFEIDPILSGKRLNPTARLTVGRQINKNLAVTYSTNLSADKNQVLAVEYRVSNRLSFVAQYEQNSTGNLTRSRDSFNFEIRLRKRF